MEDRNDNDIKNNKEEIKEENKEEEIKEDNKEDKKEEYKQEDKKEEIKEENKEENKKEEIKEEIKEENKKEENKKEEIKEEIKEENKEENKEEIKDNKNIENKEDKKDEEKKEEIQENKNIENKEDKKDEDKKEENKEDKKEDKKVDKKEDKKEDTKEEVELEKKNENNKEGIKEGNKEDKKDENSKEENKDEKKEEVNLENKEENKKDREEKIEEVKENNKEENKDNNKNESTDNNEENKQENKDDNQEINKIENNDANKGENKIEDEEGIKKENKEENNENNKEENKNEIKVENQDANKEANNDDNKEQNIIENNEEKKEDERKEIKDIIKEEENIENKEALDNQKDKDNKEKDQIINEEKNNEKEEKKEDDENINENSILGDIFRSVVKIKQKQPKENLNVSLYKNLDNEPKSFGSIIKAKLNEIKQNTLNFFDKISKEFDKRYSEYINNINKYINENELKMSKLLENQKDLIENENILDFADNHIFENFDNIFEMHQNIFDSIEDNIDLLKLFLEQSTLIQQKNPLESYINNNTTEILNSWFLNKIDYQKLNLSNIIMNEFLSDLCSNYLCKKKEYNFSSITINSKDKGTLPLESIFTKDKFNSLKKIKFIDLRSDEMNSLFKMANINTNINKSQNKVDDCNSSVEKLSSLTLINSDLSSNDLNNINPPSLIKLKLKRNILSFNLQSSLGKILGKTLTLQKLYLQKSSIDNHSLSEVFEFLSDSTKIFDTLQIVSFAGNDITKVDLKNNLTKKQCVFKNLKYLDFCKNNIFDFSQENFPFFPELKILDLTDNNMSNHLFFDNTRKNPDIIVLLSNNLFLNNNKKNAEDFRKYLNNKLNQFNHKITKLDFSFLYNKNLLDQLIDLKLSPIVKISLIKLNLSYCGLNDTTSCQLLQNNFGLLNLKDLNLSNNFITIEIFNLLLKNEVPLDNLHSLDLSMNEITSVKFDDFKKIDLFIQLNSKMKKIKFQETKFVQELLVILLSKKEEFQQISQRLSNKGVKFIVEKENMVLIKPLESLFEIKDKEIDTY